MEYRNFGVKVLALRLQGWSLWGGAGAAPCQAQTIPVASLQGTAQLSSQDSGAAGKVGVRKGKKLPNKWGAWELPFPILPEPPGAGWWVRCEGVKLNLEGKKRNYGLIFVCFPLSKSIWYFKVLILLHLVRSHQNVRLHLHLVLKGSNKQTSEG